MKGATDSYRVEIIVMRIDIDVQKNAIVVVGVQRNPMVNVHEIKLDVAERHELDTVLVVSTSATTAVVYGVTMPSIIIL